MSDDAEEPDILAEDAEATEPLPEILVYGMGNGLIGATISMLVDAEGPNLGESYKTQLVMGRHPDELYDRVVSVLIGQYGLSQDDAQAAMDAATPLTTTDGGSSFVPSNGGEMSGTLILLGTPPLQVGDQADFQLTYVAPNRVLQWSTDYSYHWDETTQKHWWVNPSGPLMSLEDTGDLGVKNNIEAGGYITQEAGPPVDPLHCATKQYVDDLEARVAALEAAAA